MTTETRWVFLYDDRAGNEIGTGLRKVEAIVGHKWVRLRSATWDHENYPKRRIRIKRSDWDIILRATELRSAKAFEASQQKLARLEYFEKHGRYPSRRLPMALRV
ncbi:MAG: hypothetical protein V3V96_06650 [Acidiferrobacterales bacterium]